MRKAYKYRIYPNEEQKSQLAKMFGCCRFVYNKTLAYRKEIFEKSHRMPTVKDCITYYHKELKPTYPWLTEADEPALINAIYHMDLAYRQAQKSHGSYPKFKCKHDSHKSYTTNMSKSNISVEFTGNTIMLPMLSPIKATLHRTFVGQIKSATISQSWSGKYYVSLVTESAHQDLPHTTKNIGLNLRNKDVCVTSDDREYVYADPATKHTKRLARLQKQLQRKEKGSRNYYKLKKEIALCHERITNTRKDTLHKISHEIISENQVIIFENLQSNSNCDPSAVLIEFQKLLECKAKWNHRYYVKVNPHLLDSFVDSHPNSTKHPKDVAKQILRIGMQQIA